MGNEATRPCCCGKAFHVRRSLPAAGEACHFRIPTTGGLLGPQTFTVFDASAKERTTWLTLEPSSKGLDRRAGGLKLHAVPRDLSGEPLVEVELDAWALRRMVDEEEMAHRARWTSEGYGNQYVWEASRVIRASAKARASRAADSAGKPFEESLPELAPALASPASSAQLRVSYRGLAGSTNTPDALPEIFIGEADLEVAVCVKEWSCSLAFLGEPMDVEMDVELEQGTLKFRSSQPEFSVLFTQGGDVRIRIAPGSSVDDSLVLCALGFCAANWSGPLVAEAVSAEKAEELVLQELREGIAAAMNAR